MNSATEAPSEWDLDVVIVTHQSAAHLAGCVAGLPQGVRRIVVDNASTDGSADVARQLGCEVLRNAANDGFARAANRAVRKKVRAGHILLLNPDAAVSVPDLARLLQAVTEDGVAVAGPRLHDPSGVEQRPWWDFPSPSRAWKEAFGLHRLRPPDFGRSADVPFVVGACLLVRTAAFRAVGGFDERYWLYGEEADLCKRLRSAGWRVRYVADAVATHVGGASSNGASSELVREHFIRGSERFVLTHHGAASLMAYRVANVVGSALRLPLLRHSDERRRTRVTLMRRSARSLFQSATLVTCEPPPSAPRCLVVCSLEAWDEVWRRNQFLIRELTDRDPSLRVLFVEPASDPLHDLLVRRRRPTFSRRRLRPVPERPQVIRFQPIKPAPRRLGAWVDRSLTRQVLQAARRAEIVNPTLWINDLGLAPLATVCSWPVLYDVTDDWLASSVSPQSREELRRREDQLLRVAGVVVVCSPDLVRTKGSRRPVRLVPNAVDAAHFRDPQPRPADLPAAPVAVYVGTLHDDRVDVELALRTAEMLPGVQFAFVGPNACSAASTDRLRSMENIHLLGGRPYGAVPAYLQHASVIIVPHVVSEFTESLDPIKAYECLAVGRPTLATPVAGFRDLAGSISLAGRDDFPARLQGLIDADSAPIVPDAGVPTWAERAEEFDTALRAARSPDVKSFDPPLRVVYVGHTARLSGGELALARLLPALRSYGVDPYVILGDDGPLVEELRGVGVTVEVLPMAAGLRDLRRERITPLRLPARSAVLTAKYVWRLRGRLRALRPDIVHTNTLKAAIYGGVAGRTAGVPVIWHIRDRIERDYLPSSAVRAVRSLVRVLPRAVIANSETTRATLGALQSRATAVASPVAYDTVERPPSWRRAPSPALVIGILGRLSPWKGQHVFLEAFAKAFPDGPVRAVIIGAPLFGEEEYAASLHVLSESLGLSDRVTFTGFRSDVFTALAEIDVLVHASTIPEPFGQVVIEGMAAGLPVIAAAAGGPLEIITHGVDGVLVPMNDVGALAEQLRVLADDEAMRRRLAKHGRRRAGDFAPQKIAGQVASLYIRVSERAKAPSRGNSSGSARPAASPTRRLDWSRKSTQRAI